MSQKTAIQRRYSLLGPKVAQALKKRHFEAYYCETGEEAVAQVFNLIPKEDVVSFGGSETVKDLGILAELDKRNYTVLNRDKARSPEERVEIMRKALLCDTFLTSSNAITEDGQLFNIDKNGNRVAAMIYGPKSVIVVAGMNKVVKTMEEAVARARYTAAPFNIQRLGDAKTPCGLTGACADCTGSDSICAYLVHTRICNPPGKIKVVLVGESLGF